MTKKLKVLLLGANGRIGSHFVDDYFKYEYNKKYELVLGVRDKNKFKESRLDVKEFNLIHLDSLLSAMKGIDIVLNLAANPNTPAEFKDLIEPNIIGTYNVLEAARLSGVRRVIMASSVHAVKGYDEGKEVRGYDAPRPINLYGATKAFVEAMCHVYYKKYGMSCIAIRIGAYVTDDLKEQICFTRDNYDYVISQKDMAQLFNKTILAGKSLKYAVLSGSSNKKGKRLNLECTEKLVGYKPVDDIVRLCKNVKKK